MQSGFFVLPAITGAYGLDAGNFSTIERLYAICSTASVPAIAVGGCTSPQGRDSISVPIDAHAGLVGIGVPPTEDY